MAAVTIQSFAVSFDTLVKIASPILVAIVGFFLRRFFAARPRLITYVVHAAAHPIPPPLPPPAAEGTPNPAAGQAVVPANQGAPTQPLIRWVHTHAIVVKNTGKVSAKNIRISHQVLPESFAVYPPVTHTVNMGATGGGAEILIPVMVPSEQVTISYLYFPPLTWTQIVGPVKSDEAMAKEIPAIPVPPPPRIVIWLLWMLVFVGASTLVYWLLRLIRLWVQFS